MNKYTLASHCYGTILGHDVVLLDVAQRQKERQYVLLKNGASVIPALLTGTAGSGDPALAAIIEAMAKAGWLIDRPDHFVSTTTGASRKQRASWLPPGNHQVALHLEAFVVLHRITGSLQGNAFLSLMQKIVALPTHRSSTDDPRVPRILQAVQDAARIPHAPMTCLHQSLAMCWMLRARGINVHVAIRVQQHPLLAHMIVIEDSHVLSWKPGLVSPTTLEHFLSASRLLFHSGELHVHFRSEEKAI